MKRDAGKKFADDRLAICLAALHVAGRSDDIVVVGNEVPQERRRYLYAVPDQVAGERGPGISRLSREVERSGAICGVDWDRSSATYGLRFIPSFAPLPRALRDFAGEEARAEWRSWRAQERKISATVARLAEMVVANPTIELDSVAAQPTRETDEGRGPATRARRSVRQEVM